MADNTEIIVVSNKHKHVKPFKTKAHRTQNFQLWLFLGLPGKEGKGGISKIVKKTLDVTWTSTITVTLRKWRQLSEPNARWRRLGLASKATSSWCLSSTEIMRNIILYIFCKYTEFQTPHSLSGSPSNGSNSEYPCPIGVIYNNKYCDFALVVQRTWYLKVHLVFCSFTKVHVWKNEWQLLCYWFNDKS